MWFFLRFDRIGSLFCLNLLLFLFIPTTTAEILCLEGERHSGSKSVKVTTNKHPACRTTLLFSAKSGKISKVIDLKYGSRSEEVPSPEHGVSCEFFAKSSGGQMEISTNYELKNDNDESKVECFCNNYDLCNAYPKVFLNYLNEMKDRKRAFVVSEYITEIEKDFEITKQQLGAVFELIEKNRAATAKAGETREPESLEMIGNTTVPAPDPGDEKAFFNIKGFKVSKTTVIIASASAGGIVLILLILIVCLVPYIIKLKRERYKKWLEKTWDQRVREAGEELDRLSKDEIAKKGKKGFRDMSKEGSKEGIGSAEGGAGGGGGGGGKGGGFKGSNESLDGPDQKPPPPQWAGGSSDDDPFGGYVSKIGHINMPAVSQYPPQVPY